MTNLDTKNLQGQIPGNINFTNVDYSTTHAITFRIDVAGAKTLNTGALLPGDTGALAKEAMGDAQFNAQEVAIEAMDAANPVEGWKNMDGLFFYDSTKIYNINVNYTTKQFTYSAE